MADNNTTMLDRLDTIEERLRRLEERIDRGGMRELADWSFSGRKNQSRRTITASVTKTGFDKMTENWIYHDQG